MPVYRMNRVAPNICCVCADEGAYRLYHCYAETPYAHRDLSKIIFAVEEILELINYPQRATDMRSFKQKNGSEAYVKKEREKAMSVESVTSQKGEKATFVVHVQYRQNATWQGSVVWAEKNQTKQFRSALELLKLIDSALDEGDKENENQKQSEKQG